MGMLRPGVNSPHRPLFVEAHAWGGRVLVLISFITVLTGIAALHLVANSVSSAWLVVVLLLVGFQICAGLLFEFVLKKTMTRRGIVAEVDMVQIPYTQPQEEDDSEEVYTSD